MLNINVNYCKYKYERAHSHAYTYKFMCVCVCGLCLSMWWLREIVLRWVYILAKQIRIYRKHKYKEQKTRTRGREEKIHIYIYIYKIKEKTYLKTQINCRIFIASSFPIIASTLAPKRHLPLATCHVAEKSRAQTIPMAEEIFSVLNGLKSLQLPPRIPPRWL